VYDIIYRTRSYNRNSRDHATSHIHTIMSQIQLTPDQKIGIIGYGLMGLTWRPEHLLVDNETAFTAMSTALSLGANFWDGGEFYGTVDRNSCHLLADYFTAHSEAASKVVLSIKGGAAVGSFEPDSSEANLRRSVNDCLTALRGTKSIDLYQCARVDPNYSIEETMTVLGKLVQEGLIRGIGLSEVRATTISRAAKIHPIVAVEVELSLFSTHILRNGIAVTCAKLGIPIVAYSPLGRGALAGNTIRKKADLPEGDRRRGMPRFQDDVLEWNARLVDAVDEFAKKRGYTKAQVAIGWVRGLSGRTLELMDENGQKVQCTLGSIVPIPGATREERVRENLTPVTLNDDEVDELTRLAFELAARGDRYPAAMQKHIDG
jgi:pyridoxine 4-dehydrogenase